MNIKVVIYISLSAVLLSTACGDSEDGGNDNTDDTDPVECTPIMPAGTGAIGDPCTEMEDCASAFCATFSHTPADADAVCAEAPPVGDVRVMATVTDFMTGEVIPNQELKLGGAIDVSQNPTGFPVAQVLTADENGQIDLVLTGAAVALPLGIVVVAEADGYYPTSTGFVKPEAGCNTYPPGVRNPDVKMMRADDLENLSNLLVQSFPDVTSEVPLGENGGVVGTIKYVENGEGVAGAHLLSTRADSSVAAVYYLNEAGDGFVDDVSSSNGLFVIINPGLAETFTAYIGDEAVSREDATMGETSGVLFATTVQVEGYL